MPGWRSDTVAEIYQMGRLKGLSIIRRSALARRRQSDASSTTPKQPCVAQAAQGCLGCLLTDSTMGGGQGRGSDGVGRLLGSAPALQASELRLQAAFLPAAGRPGAPQQADRLADSAQTAAPFRQGRDRGPPLPSASSWRRCRRGRKAVPLGDAPGQRGPQRPRRRLDATPRRGWPARAPTACGNGAADAIPASAPPAQSSRGSGHAPAGRPAAARRRHPLCG